MRCLRQHLVLSSLCECLFFYPKWKKKTHLSIRCCNRFSFSILRLIDTIRKEIAFFISIFSSSSCLFQFFCRVTKCHFQHLICIIQVSPSLYSQRVFANYTCSCVVSHRKRIHTYLFECLFFKPTDRFCFFFFSPMDVALNHIEHRFIIKVPISFHSVTFFPFVIRFVGSLLRSLGRSLACLTV